MSEQTDTTPVSFIAGRVIYHHWDENHRLVESTRAFHSLDELLSQCLAPPVKHLVDRITLIGRDAEGRRRQLVLSFQALTEP
jgi:hypothetical protein